MPQNLEAVLSDTLLTQGSTSRIAESLLKRLATEVPKGHERQAFVRFLIHAGYCKEVLELFARWLQSKKNIPLHEFAHTLCLAKAEPTEEVLAHLTLAQKEVMADEKIQYLLNWESKYSFFREAREESVKKAKQSELDAKNKWITQIEYYQSHRMIDEEEKLLKMLLEIYPKDEYFLKQKENFKERWARAIIANQSEAKTDQELSNLEPKFTQRQVDLAEIMFSAMQKEAIQTPSYAYNFAIGFYLMELYEHSRRILTYAPESLATDWFFVEILLQSRRYIEGLDALQSLELKYADDPETTFAITYYRAIALEGIGQIGPACALLKSLVSVRPAYRSAHELLLKWTSLG